MTRKPWGRTKSAALIWVLAWTLAAPASAQSVIETMYADLRHGVGDILAVWSSPFRGESSDYATAGLVAAGVGLIALYDDEIGAWVRRNPELAPMVALEPFREDSPVKVVNFGAGKSLLQLSGGLYVLGLVLDNADIRDAAVGCTAAEKSNGLLRHFLYKGVSRERPLVIERVGEERILRPGDPYEIRIPGDDDDWYDNSFFGGHGANVMACASFFNHRYDLGLAEPVIWAVAAGVNLGRMADERHWASDVAVGAVVGYAIGRYVAARSLDRAARRDAPADSVRERRRDERSRSPFDTLLGGLFVGRARGGATTIGWRGRF